METEKTKRRPIGITALAAFYLLAAPLSLYLGLTFFNLFSVGGEESGPLSFEGLLFFYSIISVPVVFAITLVIIAVGLFSGKRWARIGTVALCLGNLAFGFFIFLWLGGMTGILLEIIFLLDMIIQLAIMYYMFTPTVKRYLR